MKEETLSPLPPTPFPAATLTLAEGHYVQLKQHLQSRSFAGLQYAAGFDDLLLSIVLPSLKNAQNANSRFCSEKTATDHVISVTRVTVNQSTIHPVYRT